MEWQFVIALILAIPFMLFPIAFIWYINSGSTGRKSSGAWQAAREKVGKNGLRDRCP